MPFRRFPGAAFGLTRATRSWVRSQSFPVLRFGGAWLAQAGFAIGQRVRVKVHKHRIVIEPAT